MLDEVSSKGYLIKTSLPASGIPLTWNTEYRLGSVSNSLAFTLPAVIGQTSAEVRLCFYVSSSTLFTPTPPSLTTLLGMDDFGQLESGYYYEISFCSIGAYNNRNYISLLVNKTQLL